VNHHVDPQFWQLYSELPANVRNLADKNFELLKRDPRHPSLHFKQIGRYWSVRVGAQYRALAVQHEADFVWFWIGHHRTYDRLIRGE
jgi:hypothetical protein